MSRMDRTGVARSLEQIAGYLDFKGENPFRVRAFTTAAKTVLAFPGDLDAALADGSLAHAKGIGPAILAIIAELITTGHAAMLDELQRDIPAGLVAMQAVPGLGAAKVRQIHDTLGITTLDDLEVAARDGRLAALPRFGARTAESVLKGITFLRQASEWRLSNQAAQEANALRDVLGRLAGVVAAHVAGDVRRRLEVVRELAIVLVSDGDVDRVIAQLDGVSGVTGVMDRGNGRATITLAGAGVVDVWVAQPADLGLALIRATGSDAHVAALEARAAERSLRLDLEALRDQQGSAAATASEEAVYGALGLAWIPPELREAGTNLVAPVPTLVTRTDLRGLLHCHTVASDGRNTIAEMAEACRAAGYAYVGVTDHSRAAAYAGGMSIEAVEAQWAEIDGYNATHSGIRVLKGVESDILVDGALDYPDEILAGFDFVIGSVHSRFNLDERSMTDRVCRALSSPYLTMLGHPTGRLLLSREGYALDIDRVIATAAKERVAIEINGDPRRLDLDWRHVIRARDAGATISIGSDAHSLGGIANMEFGTGIARKGGLGPADILNTRDAAGFMAFARARRP
ncbi:MAG TPA: PHP domain-containing protein [Gemmatimonadales bacterium]|jgi:DNA polymerase (family 10)|nr:PHP domain-containing protein [Gemmatimonadales bacterium]